MRSLVLPGMVLAAGASACDLCRFDFPEERCRLAAQVWADSGHNLVVRVPAMLFVDDGGVVVQAPPDPRRFDGLLEVMESIDAEFRCFSEDEQRGFTEEECYRVKLPWHVDVVAAESHFYRDYDEDPTPLTGLVAEPPEDRCDCVAYWDNKLWN